jgi:hypothetical protein
MPAFFKNEMYAQESAVVCGLRKEFHASVLGLNL